MRQLIFSMIVALYAPAVFADAEANANLIKASMSGNMDEVKDLVGKGADVNAATEKGLSPLMLAALKGNLPVVTFLVQKGAKVNQKDSSGMTALMAASKV